MLLHTHLYILLQIKCSCLFKIFYFIFTPIKQNTIQATFLILLSIYSTIIHSQESIVTSETQSFSDVELLNKAKSIRYTDQNTSMELANKALKISETNNNAPLSAQAHALLGKMAEGFKKPEEALAHYSQALFLFKQLNNKNGQINTSVDYSKLLLTKKEFKKADRIIDDMIAVAIENNNQRQVARTLMIKGDSLYAQKHYQGAIEKYNQSIQYLSGSNKKIQQSLARAYTNIAESFKKLKNIEQTANFYKKALDMYTTLRNKKLMARTLQVIATAERQLGNLVVALEYSMRSLEIYKEIDDPINRSEALVVAGIIYRHIGRYEKSLEQIYEAHLYYKKINNINEMANTSNQLGMIYTRLNQFDQARSFYQLSIDQPDKEIEQYFIATALREMAVIDWNSGNYDSALNMAKKALKIYEAENDKLKESLTNRVIANIYRGQEDVDNAITFYRESILLAKEIGNKIYQIKAQTALAGILIGLNNKEAITLLKSSLELCFQLNDKKQSLYAYRNLQEAEKQQGNYRESLKYAEEVIALTALLQNDRDKKNLILTKANLNSHKIETELQSLKEKAKFNQLELAKKNSEIEIAKQARTITELELMKNQYSNIALALLLAICVLLIVFIYRRFIAFKKRNKELDYLVARDPLTNCYNRRILLEHMNQIFSNLNQLEQHCMIMVDIDHFKEVNDTFGHSAGDSVLCSIANILQGCIGKSDIVARFGGEEFCIVLYRVSENKAINVAEAMRKKIEKSRVDKIKVTSSFGVTSIKFNAKSPTEFINQADKALYQSKYSGRNQVTLWDPTLEKVGEIKNIQ